MEHLHILRAGMEYLDGVLVRHKQGEGGEVVDGERVYDHAFLGRGGLHQAEPCMIGALA